MRFVSAQPGFELFAFLARAGRIAQAHQPGDCFIRHGGGGFRGQISPKVETRSALIPRDMIEMRCEVLTS